MCHPTMTRCCELFCVWGYNVRSRNSLYHHDGYIFAQSFILHTDFYFERYFKPLVRLYFNEACDIIINTEKNHTVKEGKA